MKGITYLPVLVLAVLFVLQGEGQGRMVFGRHKRHSHIIRHYQEHDNSSQPIRILKSTRVKDTPIIEKRPEPLNRLFRENICDNLKDHHAKPIKNTVLKETKNCRNNKREHINPGKQTRVRNISLLKKVERDLPKEYKSRRLI